MGPRQRTPPTGDFDPSPLGNLLTLDEEPLVLAPTSLINLLAILELAPRCDDPLYVAGCYEDLVSLITEPVYAATDCYVTYRFCEEFLGPQASFELFRLYGHYREENGREDPWELPTVGEGDLVLFLRATPLALRSPLPPASFVTYTLDIVLDLLL